MMTFQSMTGVLEVVLVLGLATSVQASDKTDQMKRNVAAALPATPPQASTGTVKNSVYTSTKSVRISDLRTPAPPPPARDRNNPTGDKNVQRGYDQHQQKYKKAQR